MYDSQIGDAATPGQSRQVGDLLSAVLQQSPDAMVVCDHRGRVVGWNQAAEALYGYTAAEMIGGDPTLLAPERLREQTQALLGHVLRGHAVHGLDVAGRRKDGSEVRVSLSVAPIVEEGEVIGLFTLGRAAHAAIDDRQRLLQLERLAAQDALTGLPNRRTFDIRFALETDRAQREGSPLSLALMDIDRFKSINDNFGHQVGDRVLKRVGAILSYEVRVGETIARVGGEEFAWILHATDAPGAVAAVERARSAIASERFGTAPALRGITLSAGVCELQPGVDEHAFYGAADAALLKAKRTGRDRVVVARSDSENDFAVDLTGKHRAEALGRI